MPPLAGETTLVTVFADVHYFFSPADYKPLHHRFDKGSYVYVHHNPANGRGRLEVANNAGTADQDAFAGALETAHIAYSYDRPTTVSIQLSSTPAQAAQQPWQLPGFDLRNERKYMYNLNSLDLYLWTPEDAIDLVEALTNLTSIGALDIQDAPDPDARAAHADKPDATLSPVVQQLEQAAIRPPYKRASTSTTEAVATASPATSSAPLNSITPGTQASADAATAFAPMPYNPAAPAAPETRIYREKTPPPPDAETGTGLQMAAGHQSQQQQAYPYNPQQQQQQQQQQVPSFAPPPTQQSIPTYPSHQSPQAPTQNTQSPSFAPPPTNPNQSPPQAHQPISPPSQQAPQGYSNYSYASTQQHQQQQQPAYAVHQQFYVPTKEEAGKIPASQLPAHSQIPGQPQQPGQTAPAASGGKVDRVERGVNKLFKKLERF